ncbi:MAG: hypothetical protein J3K34DRAFT_53187 [Monoraphidium minutum]|nr:MAG: hypothetical protein J3K34DRAFT_53187 [Monoraphidium minutum]
MGQLGVSLIALVLLLTAFTGATRALLAQRSITGVCVALGTRCTGACAPEPLAGSATGLKLQRSPRPGPKAAYKTG